jgi:hypothetical protein
VQDGIPEPVDAAQVQTDVVETQIAVSRIDGPWLPTPFRPMDIEVDGPWLWDDESQTVFSTRTSLREVDEPYVVRSARVRPTAELLRASPQASRARSPSSTPRRSRCRRTSAT